MILRTGRHFLHTPGPTAIPERVLNAMHRQPYELTDPALEEITRRCFEGLGRIFHTEGEIFIYSANGHGGWEAVIANLLSEGDRVLLPATGYFSACWGDVCRAMGVEVLDIAGDGRTGIDADRIKAALRADTRGEIRAVFAVHTDTSSGVTSDIPAIRRAIDAAGHPALLVVDAVASLAAIPFEMDRWGVDVALSASQKALMGPPGLAFIAANAKARAHSASVRRQRYYWDWTTRSGPGGYRRFCGTAPEHGLFALDAALSLFFEEGEEAVIARHRRLADAVRAAVDTWSEAGALAFNVLRTHERSDSVTTILTPPGFNAAVIRTHARDVRSLALGGGLGELTGRAFRIGHLGDLNEPMILGCLATVELVLADLGIPYGKGGVQAAIATLHASTEVSS